MKIHATTKPRANRCKTKKSSRKNKKTFKKKNNELIDIPAGLSIYSGMFISELIPE